VLLAVLHKVLVTRGRLPVRGVLGQLDGERSEVPRKKVWSLPPKLNQAEAEEIEHLSVETQLTKSELGRGR
jgi:hypothetical protein